MDIPRKGTESVEHLPLSKKPLLSLRLCEGDFMFSNDWKIGNAGANDRSRTDDLFITNELLYQLSYIGQSRAEINTAPAVARQGSAVQKLF